MRRQRWFTGHPIQSKYLWMVIFAMLAPALVMGACLYYLMFELLARQMVFPEAISGTLVPVMRRVNLVMLIGLPVIGTIVWWMAVVISHRFAGPIQRLEMELDKVLAGDHTRVISTRENDDLKGIVFRINLLIEKIKK